MQGVYDELRSYLFDLTIIDTHEHLPAREEYRNQDADVLSEYTSRYFGQDLMSAGLSLADYQKVTNPSLPLPERWALVEPYWDYARRTGYGRALELSANGIYGVAEINRSTIEALNEAFLQSIKPGTFHRVIRDSNLLL